MDEDCYEQMKARPQRSASDSQEATASAQVKFSVYVNLSRSKHLGMFQEHKKMFCDTHLEQPVKNFAACITCQVLR